MHVAPSNRLSHCVTTHGHARALRCASEEFLAFWKNVVGSGYSQEDILEEVQMMIDGGSWVDFDDGRTT